MRKRPKQRWAGLKWFNLSYSVFFNRRNVRPVLLQRTRHWLRERRLPGWKRHRSQPRSGHLDSPNFTLFGFWYQKVAILGRCLPMLAFLFKGRRPRETKENCCIVTRPYFHPDTPLDINLLWHGEVETKLDARSPLSLTLIYDCCRFAANKFMNRPKHTPSTVPIGFCDYGFNGQSGFSDQ